MDFARMTRSAQQTATKRRKILTRELRSYTRREIYLLTSDRCDWSTRGPSLYYFYNIQLYGPKARAKVLYLITQWSLEPSIADELFLDLSL